MPYEAGDNAFGRLLMDSSSPTPLLQAASLAYAATCFLERECGLSPLTF